MSGKKAKRERFWQECGRMKCLPQPNESFETDKGRISGLFCQIHQKQRCHQAFPHCRQLQSLSNFVHSPSRLIWDLHIFFPTFSRTSFPPVTSPSCSSDNCLNSFTFFSIISSFKKSKSKLQVITSIIMPNYRRWKKAVG